MKILYYRLQDTVDSIDAVGSILYCTQRIADNMGPMQPTDELEEGFYYTLTPIWLTEKEFNHLKEMNQ